MNETTKRARVPELQDGQTVQIIGKHPWAGERGTLVDGLGQGSRKTYL